MLDDNRELFIAETQETVKAHPGFMLFATQNPPGHYGGRKVRRLCYNTFTVIFFKFVSYGALQQYIPCKDNKKEANFKRHCYSTNISDLRQLRTIIILLVAEKIDLESDFLLTS